MCSRDKIQGKCIHNNQSIVEKLLWIEQVFQKFPGMCNNTSKRALNRTQLKINKITSRTPYYLRFYSTWAIELGGLQETQLESTELGLESRLFARKSFTFSIADPSKKKQKYRT